MKELEGFNEELASKLISELDNIEVEDTDKFVMKELLRSRGDDIRFKTDLKDNQINAITRLMMADKVIREHDKFISSNSSKKEDFNSIIQSTTYLYMQLLVSRERKGRAEFIDAWKGASLKDKMSGLVGRFTGQNRDI